MSDHFSLALGIGTQNMAGDWLEVFYPQPILHPQAKLVQVLGRQLGYTDGNQAIALPTSQCAVLGKALADAGFAELGALADSLQHSTRPLVATILETDDAPTTTPGAYLKLHLLSHRLVKPHEVVLAGLFPLLPNVAWTNQGAIDIHELPQRQLAARLRGEDLQVHSVDKFPSMTSYVVPPGVRIADTARVRLGAYIGEGTTVMHEGFINFNAGTAGTSMVEGRISAGVFVGKGSDLGGGCSTMGTLSGGGNIVIAVGEGCLIGANAGIGIPLGDRCTVEAGLYITAGLKVALLDENDHQLGIVKARELANQPDLLFRRNSQTGAIECKTNKSAIVLNDMLHSNN